MMPRESRTLPLARIVGGTLLVLWLLFAPLLNLWNGQRSFAVIAGAETPREFLSRTLGMTPVMEWIDQNAPQNARFAVYGEPRCYYLNRTYFWGDTPHNLLVQSQLDAGKSLLDSLKSLGATHVLLNVEPAQNNGVFGPQQPQFDEMVQSGGARLLFEARGYQVYELNSTP